MGATSKLTAQAQVSVPVAIRRKLGLGPGSVLAWDAEGDRVVVRRLGTHASIDVHEPLFGVVPARKSAVQVRAGVRAYVRKRHARG